MSKDDQPHSKREPIKIRLLRFVSPQDGAGLNVASSVTASDVAGRSRHTIEWLPWLRSYRITFTPPGNEPVIVGLIHEHRVMYAEPVGELP